MASVADGKIFKITERQAAAAFERSAVGGYHWEACRNNASILEILFYNIFDVLVRLRSPTVELGNHASMSSVWQSFSSEHAEVYILSRIFFAIDSEALAASSSFSTVSVI